MTALAGRVALVTGGGWNLGRAVALRFAREGARVVVAGRRTEQLAETVAAIAEQDGVALGVPTDVTDWEATAALVARAEERFGRVDTLAAFAGGGGTEASFAEGDPARWAAVLNANLLGTYHAARAVAPGMIARGAGTIVTCAGGGALHPILEAAATAYASAKAGIARFTDQLAVELGPHGVRVNCLLPAATPVKGGEAPRAAAAELASWLASDASDPLSGRIVATTEDWWRDPTWVARVQGSLHAACLRRQEP